MLDTPLTRLNRQTGEDAHPLADKLNDGLILCKLVNAVKPGIVKAGPAKMPFHKASCAWFGFVSLTLIADGERKDALSILIRFDLVRRSTASLRPPRSSESRSRVRSSCWLKPMFLT